MTSSPRTLQRVAQRAPALPRGRRLPIWRDVLVGLAWVSTALAVALYLADGTVQQIRSIPTALHALGIVAGLVATNSMLFMLLLAARVPAIDRVIGQVKAMEWHRQLGQITVLGVLAHAALILTEVAWTSRDGLLGAISMLWEGDLLLASASVVLLVLIAITSVVAVRRRLRYEIWHVVHILSYVAVLLAIPHMFSMGSVFLPGTMQRVYWATLLLAVGACLLGYRVLTPLYRSWRHQLRLVENVRLAPDLLHLEFAGRDLDKLEARGGQYFTWRLLTPQLWRQAHPFSLSAAPTNNRLRITIRITGDGTAELAAAKPGTRVMFAGPYGAFTDASRTRDGLVLIGAGTGVAPIRSLLETTTAHPADTVVILRASRPEDLLLLSEFRGLCSSRGIALHLMVGPRYEGRWVSANYAHHDLSTLVPDVKNSDVFVCGPRGFVDSVLAEARSLGVASEQCHEERFSL